MTRNPWKTTTAPTPARRLPATVAGPWAVFMAFATAAAGAMAQAPAPAASAASAAAAPVADDARAYVEFVQEFTSTCVNRNGVQILVKSKHPTRKLRVWLDRIHMGQGTGDRSRSDLAPGGPPEALGCSRSLTGPQEWRIVKATFID